MTLEDMQNTWSEMTERIEKQEHLTNTLIMKMTQEKFKNKIGKISKYESAGAVICFIMAGAIILNISIFDTWYLLVSAIGVAAYLIVIPLIVLKYIRNMMTINIANNNYKESLTEFTKKRGQFLFWQRFAIFMNLFLMVFILPVSSKLFKGKDLFLEGGSFWIWYCIVMLVFLIPFSLWGYNSYKRMTASAHNILKDLEAS